MKYTERIALEQFNYLEIEADTLTELREAVALAKAQYSERLHKPQTEGSGGPTAPFGNTLPPKDANSCKTCGAVMEFRKGYNRQKKKGWQGYFCPNSVKGQPGHDPIWV